MIPRTSANVPSFAVKNRERVVAAGAGDEPGEHHAVEAFADDHAGGQQDSEPLLTFDVATGAVGPLVVEPAE